MCQRGPDIGREMEYLLATGNLRSRSGLGLQQVKRPRDLGIFLDLVHVELEHAKFEYLQTGERRYGHRTCT